jgi:hypothetical protein
VEEQKTPSPAELSRGLAKIRVRRWFFFGVVLIYVPALLVVLRVSQSGQTTLTMFGIWVFVLIISVVLAATVRCPRCKGHYHTNGPTFLPVRKCVHCGLFINADKKK